MPKRGSKSKGAIHSRRSVGFTERKYQQQINTPTLEKRMVYAARQGISNGSLRYINTTQLDTTGCACILN